VQAAETGADDHDLGVLFTAQRRSGGQAISATVGVIAGDMLRGLLKHTSLMKLSFYNFMKKYSINFIQTTHLFGDLCHG
jgi:hypothetical protein